MVRSLIEAYLHGRLSESEAQSVQEYLSENADSPEVSAILEEFFEASRVEAGDRDLSALEEVHSHLRMKSRRRSSYVRWAFAAAAAVVVLLLIVPLAFRAGYNSRPQEPETVWNEMRVPLAQTGEITLPDGTVLKLGASTRVTWPETFKGNERKIFLDGEVFADVAKDSLRPFIIRSGNIGVTVHGTTFSFKSYISDEVAELILRSGSLSMDIPSENGVRELKLSPGDVAQYNRSSGEVSLTRLPGEDLPLAPLGRSFSFVNIPLGDIALELERSFGKHIVVADSKTASRRFFAIFNNDESLDEILKLLTSNGGLKLSRPSPDTIIIYNPN